MSPQTGKLAFGWALFILLLSGGMLPFQEAGTAEYYITGVTFLLAVLFAIAVVIIARLSR